ncbi:MAG: dihydroorotate dehydrogenase [Rhizobium sp. 63-7]|nr:MAG: dihydroorotate dehydrogenase [Rhizobium sp. 63-7]
MTAIVYKIVPETLWHEARQTGVFHGAAIDLKDGYIHFSTGPQAKETARLHFAGVTGLLLVAADADALGEALRFEASRGGDLFPHLYGDLSLSAVLWEKPLPVGADGFHVFPELDR